MEINDTWSEVFVRVDPANIFNCILINKQCLEVITAPGFRRMYGKRWNLIHLNSPIVGFLTHGASLNNVVYMSLKATSKFMMNPNLLEDDVKARFVSRSGTGDILYGVLPNILYVMSPAADNNPVKLPKQCSWNWRQYAPAILSKHDSSYKVILIRQNSFSTEIRTFHSSSGKWEFSDQKSEHNVSMGLLPGIVSSSRGLVYWPRCDVTEGPLLVAVYDDNNEQEPVSWISGPPVNTTAGIPGNHYDNSKVKHDYGMSPQGHLQCAVQTWTNGFPWGDIHIFCFDDNKVWKKLHYVRSSTRFGGISFVSFVPGKSDRFFVRTFASRISFVYNLEDGKMDRFGCESDKHWMPRPDDYVDLSPLTIADLGVWPSSPFSSTTQSHTQTGTNNIRNVKQILTVASVSRMEYVNK